MALTSSLIPEARAQRGVNYGSLIHQTRIPHVFYNQLTLPSADSSQTTFLIDYRIDYNYLPFKKMERPDEGPGRSFYATATMSLEVFKDNGEDKKSRDPATLQELNSVGRSIRKDTAYATTYEQTQSKKHYLAGYLSVDLKPGPYSYLLQLTPGEDMDERNSRRENMKLDDYGNAHKPEIYILDRVDNKQEPGRVRLMNFGNNVYYGKDFYALLLLPDYKTSDEYSVEVQQMEVGKRDTTAQKSVFSTTLGIRQVLQHRIPRIDKDSSRLSLRLEKKSQGGYAYAFLKIPNRQFANAVYRLELHKKGDDKPVSRQMFRSRWIDMPTSLLNVDVAIDMLHYITDRETIKKLKDGDEQQREKNFRAFWKKKDPTPDTEYNELMAEYYRRVDYAYEEFTTPQQPGYDSDRGKIYIKYGPPDHVKRTFPTNQPTTEIWTYGNRKFVFQATTGFGDFQLVSQS